MSQKEYCFDATYDEYAVQAFGDNEAELIADCYYGRDPIGAGVNTWYPLSDAPEWLYNRILKDIKQFLTQEFETCMTIK